MSLIDKLIEWIFGRTEYVGTVVGITEWEDGDTWRASYVLWTEGGRRRFKMSGRQGHSEHCREVEAKVEAWAKGGPLPHVLGQPKPSGQGELIVFPGGKPA